MAQTNEPDWNFDNTTNHATHRQSGAVIEFGRSIGNQQEPWARISLANGWFAAVRRIDSKLLSTQEIIDLREEAIRLFENHLPVR